MGGWTLARGKEVEQTLADVVAAGATQIALDGANAIFAVGQLLFISEADGAETEFLGAVKEATPTTLAFALPLERSKNSGALLWRAATSFVTGAEEVLPVRRRVNTGVTLERSLGGVAYAIRTASPATTLEWGLDGLTPAREAELVAWIEAATESGLRAFTLVGPMRRLTAVRLSQDEYLRQTQAGDRLSLRLPLAIESEGKYI